MKKTIFIFFAIFFVLSPILVFGAGTEVNYPNVPGPGPTHWVGPGTSFVTYAGYLFYLAIAIGGIIALVVIVWAGFIYLTSTTSPTKKNEAKRKILAALLGLIILIAAYAILATINPQLLILSLQEVIPTSTSPISGPATPTTTFTEIPLGTLVENILGKNISCFDKDKNLIDCQESQCFATTSGYICKDGIQFQGSATTTFASTYPQIATSSLIFVQDTDFRYCYTYDSDGNKKGLLEYKDQYECIRNLLPAMEKKTKDLADLVGQLKSLSEDLYLLVNTLKTKAHDCKCTEGCSRSIDSHCDCCDEDHPDCSECDCECSNSGDLCPRTQMDNLRNEIREEIKELEKKRIKIYAFIHGANSTSTLLNESNSFSWYQTLDPDLDWGSSTTTIYYIEEWDPKATSTFLTYQEGIDRLKFFIDELTRDFNDLQEAENKMKDPYGDRLTLIEFLNLKKKDPRQVITKKFRNQHFKDYEIDKYCWDFNCTGTTIEGVCDECATSTEGRMCEIENGREQFIYDGDPATFYYHPDYNEERVLTKEKCTIDKNREEGFRLGEIPIGQTVDDTEDFATSTIAQLQSVYNELYWAREEALSARDNAGDEIDNAWNLIEYTSHGRPAGDTPSDDCVDECKEVPCSCSCWCDCTGTCGPCCDGGEDCEGGCYDSYSYGGDTECSGDPCPYNSIDSAVSKIQKLHNNPSPPLGIVQLHTSLSARPGNILTSSNQFINLIEAKISPYHISSSLTSSNRCTILHKLTNARRKLQKCFSGFSFSSKTGKVKKRVFSSKIGLDLYHGRKLVILPDDFFYKSGKIDAYPYNSDKLSPSQQSQCRANRVSTDCWNAIRDLLEDYYCCETVP